MKRSFGLAWIGAALLLLWCIPASADSFTNAQLTIGNVSGTASGTFTYTSSNNTFSNISIQFQSSIGNVNVNLNSMKGTAVGQNLVAFQGLTTVNGLQVWYSITLNTQNNSFWATGSISKGFSYFGAFGDQYMSVPEGGTTLGYLLLAGMAMCAGILVSGKQRLAAHVADTATPPMSSAVQS